MNVNNGNGHGVYALELNGGDDEIQVGGVLGKVLRPMDSSWGIVRLNLSDWSGEAVWHLVA